MPGSASSMVHPQPTRAVRLCKLGFAMALPEPLDDFWSEWRALNGSRRPTAWGEVVTDARYPLVWESNHAAVLRDHDSVSAADIRGELLPALQQAGARNEHVEFWAPPPGCPVIVQMARGSDHLGTDSIMVHEGGPDALLATPRHAGVRVRELEDPDEDFWSVYRSRRDEFGAGLRSDSTSGSGSDPGPRSRASPGAFHN